MLQGSSVRSNPESVAESERRGAREGKDIVLATTYKYD